MTHQTFTTDYFVYLYTYTMTDQTFMTDYFVLYCTVTWWSIKLLLLTTLYIVHLHYDPSNLYYWLLCILCTYTMADQTFTTDYFVYCALTLWPIKPLLWTTWYIVHLHYDPWNLYYWLLCILCTYTMVHQTFTTDYIAYIMLSYFILFSIIMLLYYNPP